MQNLKCDFHQQIGITDTNVFLKGHFRGLYICHGKCQQITRIVPLSQVYRMSITFLKRRYSQPALTLLSEYQNNFIFE